MEKIYQYSFNPQEGTLEKMELCYEKTNLHYRVYTDVENDEYMYINHNEIDKVKEDEYSDDIYLLTTKEDEKEVWKLFHKQIAEQIYKHQLAVEYFEAMLELIDRNLPETPEKDVMQKDGGMEIGDD